MCEYVHSVVCSVFTDGTVCMIPVILIIDITMHAISFLLWQLITRVLIVHTPQGIVNVPDHPFWILWSCCASKVGLMIGIIGVHWCGFSCMCIPACIALCTHWQIVTGVPVRVSKTLGHAPDQRASGKQSAAWIIFAQATYTYSPVVANSSAALFSQAAPRE